MSLVLITGGAGFIGSYLSKCLLKQGFEIRILDSLEPQIHGVLPVGLDWLKNEKIDFIRGSVADRGVVEKALAGVDVLIHLAAETGTGQSMYEIERYNNVNSQSTALILDLLTNDKELNVKKFILSSSRSVYGEGAYKCLSCDDGTRYHPSARGYEQLRQGVWDPICFRCSTPLRAIPTIEEDKISPASIYAATKCAQEDLVRICCGAIEVDYAILRFQNVYGEGQSLNNPYTGILSIFSTRIRRGLELTLFEDGEESRDFVHVEDVCGAICAAVSAKQSIDGVINIGSGIATSVAEVAQKLSAYLNIEVPIRVTGEYRVGDIRHNFADIEKMKGILGYEPKVTLDSGLERFCRWVLTQPLPEDLLEQANEELRARKLMG